MLICNLDLRRSDARLTTRLDGAIFAARNAWTNEDSMTRLSVPDMSCGHCKASVEAALAALPDTGAVRVDLASRTVEVEGAAPLPALLAALDAAGYPASAAG
jgi:copper chaperone